MTTASKMMAYFIKNDRFDFTYDGDMYARIMFLKGAVKEVEYLPGLATAIVGYAFADRGEQLAWTVVEKTNGVYDVTRYFIEEVIAQYDTFGDDLESERDHVVAMMGDDIEVACSTAGWSIRRTVPVDRSEARYWIRKSAGEPFKPILDADAFTHVLRSGGDVHVEKGLGVAWDVIKSVVEAREDYSEYHDESQAEDLATLSFFDLNEVLYK